MLFDLLDTIHNETAGARMDIHPHNICYIKLNQNHSNPVTQWPTGGYFATKFIIYLFCVYGEENVWQNYFNWL